MPRKDVLDRLADKFTVGDDCWEWIASRQTGGYGQFRFKGTMRKAHRVVYELLVGPIPEGLDLDHLCRVRHCVRPDHLEPVTRSENLRRGLSGNAGDSIGAVNAAKTACKRGHPFDDANTYMTPNGRRQCRICRGLPQKRSACAA